MSKVPWQPNRRFRPDACESFKLRPWPASPSKYPLSGKIKGRVYCPPLANNPYRDIVIWGGVCLAMWAAFIGAAYWFAR